MRRPIIAPVPKELASSFVEDYCIKYGVPYAGDPNFGDEVLWLGAFMDDKLQAVLGLKETEYGTYVHGMYSLGTKGALRAYMGLRDVICSIPGQWWGWVRKDNRKMLQWCLSIPGWYIAGENVDHWLVKREQACLNE